MSPSALCYAGSAAPSPLGGRFFEGRPLLVDAFFFDFLQLFFGNREVRGDRLIGIANVLQIILRGDERGENLFPLLNRNSLRAH